MQPEQPANNNQKIIAAIAVLIVIVVIVFGARALSGNDSSTDSNATTSSSSETTTESDSTSDDAAAYTDGTYTATGRYVSPGGNESISITLTIADGIVTDTNADGNASGDTAAEFQGTFIEHYSEQVVGKKINDVNLDKVSGSSLTPNGFNDALEQIKADAAA